MADQPDSHTAGDKSSQPGKLPGTYKEIVKRFPAIAEAHDAMSAAVESLGPIDEKNCALIKIGISVGAGLESALRSHVRRALSAGASELEIEQAIFLGMTTVGFPRAAAAWSWAQVQFARNRSDDSTQNPGPNDSAV